MSQAPSSTSPALATSPRTKRANTPNSLLQDPEASKPTTSPKPSPRSYYNIDSISATGSSQVTSKSKPPLTSPKPDSAAKEYSTPKSTAPAMGEGGGIPRSNSYGQSQSPLSAMLKQAVAISTIQRSSSMDENLNTAVHHPLKRSSLASEYRSVGSRVPPSPVSSSPPVPPSPKLLASACVHANVLSTDAKPLAQTEGDGEVNKGQTPLHSFLVERQNDLPLLIKVCNGYLGERETDSISIGDVFSLLFLKHTEVIEVEQSEQKYYIPLNSAVQVRIPYRGGLSAYKLTVSDIMASKEPPLVIMAVTRYACSSDKSSVDEDEVFVVDGTKTVVLYRYLQVYSVTHQVMKKLKVDCTASFTTNAPLYVSDVVHHLSAKFPLNVVLYVDEEINLYSHLQSEREATLHKHVTRTAVIASLCDEGEQLGSGGSMIEVPMDTDITILELNLDKSDRKALIAKARNLLKTFNPSEVSVLSTDGKTVELVRKGHERSSYRLDVPPSLVCSEASEPKQENFKPLDDEEDDEAVNYEELDQIGVTAPQGKVEEKIVSAANNPVDVGSLAVQVNVMRRSVENMQSQTNKAESLSRSTKNQVASLRMEVTELKASLAEMGKAVAALVERVGSGFVVGNSQGVSSHADSGGGGGGNRVVGSEQQEKVPLASLSNAQVLTLLTSMGLDQYQERFQREAIDGGILSECNEYVLQHELGVVSKIHKIRLMKVIKENAVTMQSL